MNDSKKKEFKELLDALDSANEAFAKHVNIANPTAADFWAVNDANSKALRCVSDRLFILPEMKERGIQKKWFELTDIFFDKWNFEDYAPRYRDFRNEIIAIATADITR